MPRKKAVRRKTRVNLYIEFAQKEALDLLTEKTGAPIAVHVRRALDDYLKKMSK
jgi:predicted DNA-binding protein